MASGRWAEKVEEVLALLILGAGFVALFTGFEYFFLVWILGFAVLLPLVSVLLEDEEEASLADSIDSTFESIGTVIRGIDRGFQDHVEPAFEGREPRRRDDDRAAEDENSTADALDIIRQRYARGDLTDEQFERKLDRLFETTTPEDALEWRRSRRESEYETARRTG